MPRLKGNRHAASNPMFTFSPATSFIANCEDQAKVDRLWASLSEGGEPGQCGWLKDKHGVPWQVVSTILGELMRYGGPGKAESVMSAMLKMKKIDIDALKRAAQ